MTDPFRILSVDDPADAIKLARKARRVTNVHSTEVILGIQRMKRAATKWEHENGRRSEGLAASQIGWNRRVIILRKTDEMEPKNPRHFTDEEFKAACGGQDLFGPAGRKYVELVKAYDEWMRRHGSTFDPWIVMINPTIKQVEGERDSTEGCLSVPHGGYIVKRPTHVAFKFTRANRTYSGMQLAKGGNAVKLMHEVGHLNGETINQSGLPVIGGGEEKL